MKKKVQAIEVLCDFDGTIASDDIGFRIIETFAGPGWREVEDAYQRGEKGSRVALEEIFSLTKVPEHILRSFVEEHFRLDPAFGDFIEFCRRSDIEVTVLSDGFDFYIDLMLKKFRVDVPYLANHLRVVDCSLQADFPYQSEDCGSCGNCKLNYVERVRGKGSRIIYIGDGHSDRCASDVADVVFAKDALAEYCRKKGTAYIPFTDFNDILSTCNSGLLEKLRNNTFSVSCEEAK
ncbi:MAG: MtnX-like HAD-IB family phosphatase [Dethiobacter sp.]|nr:MtnX-like HAD-IB family phosphatase [Dethiobacter sp.]